MLMLTNAYENINLWGLEILQTFSVASEMLSNFGYVWKLGKVWGSQLITFCHVPQTDCVWSILGCSNCICCTKDERIVRLSFIALY